MSTSITNQQASVTVHDRITCNPGDVITMWIYTSTPVTIDGVSGSGVVPGAGAGSDAVQSLTNYMSVTHAPLV